MNDRLSKLRDEIRRLERDFTLEEIRYAVGTLGTAVDFHASDRKIRDIPKKPGIKRKPVERSIAVAKLEKSDPAKFAYLSKLEKRLRAKELLSNTGELVRFCQMLDKSFVPRKKRDDSVSALMKTLATRSLAELDSRIPSALDNASSGESDAYQRLARELIGARNRLG